MQRLVCATFLIWDGFGHLKEASSIAFVSPQMIGAGAGVFLLLGLWTPICGTLIAIVEIWVTLSSAGGGIPVMLAALGVTLAMIGPGAWSLDARLFGRRHYEVTHR